MKKNSPYHLIVGLGLTGLSCARYLHQRNIPCVVVDTRQNPSELAALRECNSEIPVHCGPFSSDIFIQAEKIILSPGVSLDEPAIQMAQQKKIPIWSDLDLFDREVKAPVIAITGSNGKSTVTTLMGELINRASKKAIVCGNIGVPVLDTLMLPVPDFYVIELSSFQLDVTHQLRAKAAVLLNISPDHLDRHHDLASYLAAKKRVYRHCEFPVVNADEPSTWQDISFATPPQLLTLTTHDTAWCVREKKGERYLAQGERCLVRVDELGLKGAHNWQNMLAALALGSMIGLSETSMIQTLREFSGLPHRCQLVKSQGGVDWYNDSKATNVGAAVAAINGLGAQTKGRIILIAGGDSKGVSLIDLRSPVKRFVSHAIVLGKDADKIKNTLTGFAEIISVSTVQAAVTEAARIAQTGDVVLLAPACSSLDQYVNFVARGNDFIQAVEAITSCGE